MKVFEKWKIEYCNKNCTVLNNCDICGGCLEFEIAVKAWKAALKWVKREAISLDERGDSSRNVINRELNE
jgi:hypothetical protein